MVPTAALTLLVSIEREMLVINVLEHTALDRAQDALSGTSASAADQDIDVNRKPHYRYRKERPTVRHRGSRI